MWNKISRRVLCSFFLCLMMAHPVFAEEISKQTLKADPDFQPLTILGHHCAGCHQAADHPGALFLNAARLGEPETIKLMIRLIETNQMPPAHSNFKKTKDGKKVLAWLKKKQTEPIR